MSEKKMVTTKCERCGRDITGPEVRICQRDYSVVCPDCDGRSR